MKIGYISTSIWNDSWFEELNPEQKLLFIYLRTNSKTSICGIFELTNKAISNETGINIENVKKYMEKFEKDKKVFRCEGYVCIANMVKHMFKPNDNIVKGINKEKSLIKAEIIQYFEGACKGLPTPSPYPPDISPSPSPSPSPSLENSPNPVGLETTPPLPKSITTTLQDRKVEFDITPASWKGFREDYPADKLEETVINAIHWIADKYEEKGRTVKDKVLRTGRLRTFLKDVPKIPKRFPYEPWVAYKIRCNPNATEYEKQIYDELVKDEKQRLNLQTND